MIAPSSPGQALQPPGRRRQNAWVNLSQTCPSCLDSCSAAESECPHCGWLFSRATVEELNALPVLVDVFADRDDGSVDIPLDIGAEPIVLNLRPVDELPEAWRPRPSSAAPSGLIWSDGNLMLMADLPASMQPLSKEGRRAEVRHRIVEEGDPASTLRVAGGTPDVLVLDTDEASRASLCGLLEGFGFRAHPASTIEQSNQLLEAKHFAAAFLELSFDGVQQTVSVPLCERVKARPKHADTPLSALIVISGNARPVERVRAALAGCDAYLAKPVTRGDVARAMESCSVPLPLDSRRS